jgi:hypothetical protein
MVKDAMLTLASMVQFLDDVESKITLSSEVGTASPDQLAAVDQLLSPPPPSQITSDAYNAHGKSRINNIASKNLETDFISSPLE